MFSSEAYGKVLLLDGEPMTDLVASPLTASLVASRAGFRLAYAENISPFAGVIQVTERDEFSYQEMITHLPLCALEVICRSQHDP